MRGVRDVDHGEGVSHGVQISATVGCGTGPFKGSVEHCHKALRRRRTVDTPDVYIRNMA